MDVAELRSLFLFDGLTDDQLEQLQAAGDEVAFDDGDVLFREGAPANSWWVLLEGTIDLVRRSDHREVVVGSMERPGIWAGGFRAWADTAGYMGTGRAASRGRVLRVASADLGRLTRDWFPLGVHLIGGFFQTVRNMEVMARQRAGLIALGTLAAGLAHELNNPATAAARAADALQETCDTLVASLVELARQSGDSGPLVRLDDLRRELEPAPAGGDSLALADREDELLTWLEDRSVERAWRLAPALAAAGVDLAWCERAASLLDHRALGPGLDWVASTATTTALLSEVSESTGRVSALVDAVRSYAQLDRASLQSIDVTDGIDSTLVVLGHQLGNGVSVVRDYAADLPPIEAHPGELNQVWTNLIHNALDAMDGRGTLRVSARADGDDVVVEVADTGPGMPADVRARAFEPFFTTKDVGRGTGLGLDISRRIVVDRHHGDITIDSVPGRTTMSVRLPRTHH